MFQMKTSFTQDFPSNLTTNISSEGMSVNLTEPALHQSNARERNFLRLRQSIERDTIMRKKARDLKEQHSDHHKLDYALLDVKKSLYSDGPSFPQQYLKVDNLSITERSNLRREMMRKEREALLKEGKTSSPENGCGRQELSDSDFSRQIHKVGSNYISKKYVDIAMKHHKENLYTNLKLPDTSEAKTKMLSSDIFNLKKGNVMIKDAEKSPNINHFFDNPDLNKRNNLMKSDIFFRENNPLTLKKSYDYFQLKPASYKQFGSCTESESGWNPVISKPNLFNYPSTNVHILNQSIKGIGRTKEEINNIDANYCTHKKKSIAEYVDLIRNFCPNKNEKYSQSLKNDENIFHQRKEVCSQYNDLYKKYNPMIAHPFTKKQ